jgi:two-component system LytT family sensor kinase
VIVAMTDAETHATHIIAAAFLNTLAPAVMGIGVWFAAAKLSWPEHRPVRLLAAHAALSMVYAAGWVAWQMAISGPLGPWRAPDYDMWRYVLPWQAAIGFILYGVVAGVSYAVRGVVRSRDLGVAAERAERLLAQAELATLRAHINPHFFFNTLHTVSQLMRVNPRKAETVLDQLSALFRYVLRLDRHNVELVTLEEEWRFTQTYLALERLRMGHRLVVRDTLDEGTLDCAVPPFTLQPLVENAIRHGLSPRIEGGTITIEARERDGMIEIVVADDGVGSSVERAQLEPGVGSRAVSQRLIARHGARARARVDTAPSAGYRVTLTFPAEPLGAALNR